MTAKRRHLRSYRTRAASLLLLATALGGGVLLLDSSDEGESAPPGASAQLAEANGRAELRGSERRARDVSNTPVRRAVPGDWPGPLNAPPGLVVEQSFAYRASTGVVASENGGEPTGEQAELELSGRLVLRVLARRERQLAVEMALPGVVAKSAGKVDARLAAVLEGPTVLLLDHAGEVDGLRFPSRSSAADRGVLRSFVRAGRFLVESGEATWQRREEDELGVALVTYEELPAAEGIQIIERSCEEYAATQVPTTVHGLASAQLRADVGLWTDVEQRRDVRVELADALGATVCVSWSLVSEFESVQAGEAAADFDWDASWSPLLDGGLDARLAAADVLLERDRAALEGRGLSDLVAELQLLCSECGLDDPRIEDLRRQLMVLFESDPASVNAAMTALADTLLDGRVAALLLSSLASVGTPACQAACAQSFAADSAHGEERRVAALQAMFSVREPTPATRAALTRAFHGRGDAVAGTALLLIGRQARDADRATVDALQALERDAVERGLLLDWLGAIGNARLADAGGRVAAYLEHADEQVRGAAVDALGNSLDPATDALLAARLDADGSPAVVARAAEWLVARGAPGARSLLQSRLGRAQSEFLRESLTQLLAAI